VGSKVAALSLARSKRSQEHARCVWSVAVQYSGGNSRGIAAGARSSEQARYCVYVSGVFNYHASSRCLSFLWDRQSTSTIDGSTVALS